MAQARKIGIVGFGQIGSYVYSQIAKRLELGLEVVFVSDVIKENLVGLPAGMVLDQIEDFAARRPDMVVELAHPIVSRKYGAMFLESADYFPLSVTAFGDAELAEKMEGTALKNGHRLYVAHGGVMGLDTIHEGADTWDKVEILMTKNPRNIDFTWSGVDGASIKGPTVVYDGPTRGICAKFPRNVNVHGTIALAGIGFDRTRSTLVLDPAQETADLKVTASGGGVVIELFKSESIKGVTGTATLTSVLGSVVRTTQGGPGLQFC